MPYSCHRQLVGQGYGAVSDGWNAPWVRLMKGPWGNINGLETVHNLQKNSNPEPKCQFCRICSNIWTYSLLCRLGVQGCLFSRDFPIISLCRSRDWEFVFQQSTVRQHCKRQRVGLTWYCLFCSPFFCKTAIFVIASYSACDLINGSCSRISTTFLVNNVQAMQPPKKR